MPATPCNPRACPEEEAPELEQEQKLSVNSPGTVRRIPAVGREQTSWPCRGEVSLTVLD